MIARIYHVLYKELTEMRRNMGVLVVVLAIPLVEIVVLSYTTAGGAENLPVAVYDSARTNTSRALITSIDADISFNIDYFTESVEEGEKLLDAGEIFVFFIIPPDMDVVLVLVDGSRTVASGYAAIYAEEIIARFASKGADSATEARIRTWYNADLKREYFFVPAQIGTMMTLIILAVTAVAIVRERERGTLEQLMVTPVRPLELIIAKLIPAAFIAYAELLIMLAIAVFWFHVPIRGSLTLFLGLASIYFVAEMGRGTFISTVSRSQGQAIPTIFLLVTLDGVLAGFFTPVSSMPLPARLLSYLFPLKYFLVMTRNIFMKEATLFDLAPQLVPLLVISALLFGGSVYMLRRRLV